MNTTNNAWIYCRNIALQDDWALPSHRHVQHARCAIIAGTGVLDGSRVQQYPTS